MALAATVYKAMYFHFDRTDLVVLDEACLLFSCKLLELIMCL